MKRDYLQRAEFLISAAKYSQSPADEGAEIAFAGRSNAGKSSAINVLCNQKNLARTSKTPGRTQLLNFFQLEGDYRLVDLPGYGYAKVPEAQRKKWEVELGRYLAERKSLCGLVLMMDCRHPMTEHDDRLLEFAAYYQRPVHILLTKSDKLKNGPANSTLHQVEKAINGYSLDISVQLFSALKRRGLEQASERIAVLLEDFNPESGSSV